MNSHCPGAGAASGQGKGLLRQAGLHYGVARKAHRGSEALPAAQNEDGASHFQDGCRAPAEP